MTIQHWFKGLAATFCLLLATVAGAEDNQSATPTVDPRLNRDDDAFMTRQAGALLASVDEILAGHPPVVPEPEVRRMTLYTLDGVLHDIYAPNRAPVQAFYQRRMAGVAEALESTRADEGAWIWKLYNHGFIVRTASVTLGFDLQRGAGQFRVNKPEGGRENVPSPGFPIGDDLVKRIVDQCDVLFISHRHGDHADPVFAQMFVDQGKAVVAPPDVFENTPLNAKLSILPREVDTLQHLPLKGGAVTLDLVVYPGQQYQNGGPPNNVVLAITPEGMCFAHNGDQINDPYPDYQEDYKWIDHVHEHYKVDVLMTNCWLNDIYRFTKGFDPKLVLPGHQNELSHQVWDRVPYWGDAEFLHLTTPALLASDYPVLVMAWGEAYHYAPTGDAPSGKR